MAKGLVDRLDAVTENLANANNPGYRRLQVTGKIFDAVLGNYMAGQPKHWTEGLRYDPVSVDFTEGPLKITERPLDFAINGSGFFTVRDPDRDKTYYTRSGHFKLDSEQRLINADGFHLQGENGEIVLPNVEDLDLVQVGRDGALTVDGMLIDNLVMAHFEDPQKLDRIGTTLFATNNETEPQEFPEESSVVGGMLEMSNASVVEEMAELISVTRAYEACQRMLRTEDDVEGKMIQQLGAR